MLLLAGSQAIAYIDRVNFAVVGPHLIKVYDYTPTQVGVLLSAFNWAFTFSLLAAGPLVDVIRPRRSYPMGVGFWSLATALCSLTKSFAPLLVFRALVGVGESVMIPSGSRVIRETFDKKHRALAVGTFFAGNRIGLTLGIPLASVVLVNWGWEWVFYMTGSLGLFWVAWWLAVYRPPPDDEAARAQPHEAQNQIRWATLLKYPTTWGVMLGQAGYLYIYYVFATWLPGYLVLQRGLSTLTTGFVGMLPFLVGTTCVILGGWAGDRLIAAGWRVTLVRKGFAVGGLFGGTVFTIAGAYTPDDVSGDHVPDAFSRKRQFLHGGGELHPDRRGAGPHRLLAGVVAEFRRERRWVLRAARHRHVDFGLRRLHGSAARGGRRGPRLRLRLVWSDCRQSRPGAGNAIGKLYDIVSQTSPTCRRSGFTSSHGKRWRHTSAAATPSSSRSERPNSMVPPGRLDWMGTWPSVLPKTLQRRPECFRLLRCGTAIPAITWGSPEPSP